MFAPRDDYFRENRNRTIFEIFHSFYILSVYDSLRKTAIPCASICEDHHIFKAKMNFDLYIISLGQKIPCFQTVFSV